MIKIKELLDKTVNVDLLVASFIPSSGIALITTEYDEKEDCEKEQTIMRPNSACGARPSFHVLGSNLPLKMNDHHPPPCEEEKIQNTHFDHRNNKTPRRF